MTADAGLGCGLASGRNTHELEVNLFDFFVKSQQKNRILGKFPEIPCDEAVKKSNQ
jgi:hypothetical protein